MKKALIAFGMLLLAAPAHADLTHKLSSSVQLTVDAAATNVQRIGNSYSVSGNGVTLDVGGGASADLNVGGLGTLSSGVAGGSIPTATQTTDGATFSFSNSFTAGDAVITTAHTAECAHKGVICHDIKLLLLFALHIFSAYGAQNICQSGFIDFPVYHLRGEANRG